MKRKLINDKFIAIEGLDGAGKSAQFQLLSDYFQTHYIKYKAIHFPQINSSPYGGLISKYLQGDFGEVQDVDPTIVSLLFALDRREISNTITQWLYQGNVVLVDRYVYSNIAFQCAKIKNQKEKEDLKNWILDLEYRYNKIPKPSLSLYLDVPIQFVSRNLSNVRVGDHRNYLNGKTDIHEKDIELQKMVSAEYESLVYTFKDFVRIDCSSRDKNQVLSPSAIFNKIIQVLENTIT